MKIRKIVSKIQEEFKLPISIGDIVLMGKFKNKRVKVKSIDTNEKGEIISIKPVEYFTNYVFINDPNSGVYGMGFGNLLGPLNEAANTLINQLIGCLNIYIQETHYESRPLVS